MEENKTREINKRRKKERKREMNLIKEDKEEILQ